MRLARRKKGLGGTEEEMKEKERGRSPLTFQSNLSIWLVPTEYRLFMDSVRTWGVLRGGGSQFTVGGLWEIF